MNAQEEFLKDTEQDTTKVDVLDAPLDGSQAPAKDGVDDKGDSEGNDADGLKPKNRRERRLLERLDAERESSVFLAGKLEAVTEARKAVTEEADYLKAIEKIYGTDSPEAILATDLLKKAMVGVRDDAENRAYERIQQERRNESKEQQDAEKELDTMVDEIEDEYGVTLTEVQERSFFQLLEKMSPKDSDGNVKEYADPHAVWEVFQEKLQKQTSSGGSRAKDLSSRSMVSSGASAESNLNTDVHARFLREQGII